jgi:hypothetical protein
MGINRSSGKARRVVQQQVQASMAEVIRGAYLTRPTKAELRAMIPAYDESMVTRVGTNARGKRPSGGAKR